jgi:hypothetical protein
MTEKEKTNLELRRELVRRFQAQHLEASTPASLELLNADMLLFGAQLCIVRDCANANRSLMLMILFKSPWRNGSDGLPIEILHQADTIVEYIDGGKWLLRKSRFATIKVTGGTVLPDLDACFKAAIL